MKKKIKRKDHKFRNSVKSHYKYCVITGKSLAVCEVAHIFPFEKSNDNEKYDELNGIVLCRELHKLFDDKKIYIDHNDYRLILSNEIINDE